MLVCKRCGQKKKSNSGEICGSCSSKIKFKWKMKIAIADNNNLKFTQDLKDHWEKKGHEVKYERGASEYLAQWADIYFVDTWDNNIHYLWKLYHGVDGVSRTPDWDNSRKPTIVVRCLDWEVWIGMVRDQSLINWVDKAICIAPHIQERLESDKDNATGNKLNWNGKLKLIRPGVNLEKFTLKKNKTDGFQLGMALGDMWWPKNHMAGLDIFTTLYRSDNRWRLHIRGQHEGGNEFWKSMYDHYLESRGIENVVTLYPQVPDMNEWYEQIDILLHPGMKEAFCYAVGESLAKGIPVVVNEFMGSRDIWSMAYLYQLHEEAVSAVKAWNIVDPEPEYHRKYIQSNYSLERMLKEFDEYLGT